MCFPFVSGLRRGRSIAPSHPGLHGSHPHPADRHKLQAVEGPYLEVAVRQQIRLASEVRPSPYLQKDRVEAVLESRLDRDQVATLRSSVHNQGVVCHQGSVLPR